MIIYNITIKAHHAVAEEWVKWMKGTHMPEVLQTGLFTDSRLCRLLGHDEEDGATFVVQYFCDSMENYDNYVSRHAPALGGKMIEKFGDKVIAFRTVMEVI